MARWDKDEGDVSLNLDQTCNCHDKFAYSLLFFLCDLERNNAIISKTPRNICMWVNVEHRFSVEFWNFTFTYKAEDFRSKREIRRLLSKTEVFCPKQKHRQVCIRGPWKITHIIVKRRSGLSHAYVKKIQNKTIVMLITDAFQQWEILNFTKRRSELHKEKIWTSQREDVRDTIIIN